MQDILIQKLHRYIQENNPDLLFSLQEQNSVHDFLLQQLSAIEPLLAQLIAANKPSLVIEEVCLEEMTKDLRPSRYLYIQSLLEEEFPGDYTHLQASGVLATELLNMTHACKEVFDTAGFSIATEDNRFLRYAISGTIHAYLQTSNETAS